MALPGFSLMWPPLLETTCEGLTAWLCRGWRPLHSSAPTGFSVCSPGVTCVCGSLRPATPAQLTSCSPFRARRKAGPVHPAPTPPQPSRQPPFLSGAGSGRPLAWPGPLRILSSLSRLVSTQQAAIHKACPQSFAHLDVPDRCRGTVPHTRVSHPESSCLQTKGSEPSYRAAHEPKMMKRDVQKPPKPETGSAFPGQLPGAPTRDAPGTPGNCDRRRDPR